MAASYGSTRTVALVSILVSVWSTGTSLRGDLRLVDGGQSSQGRVELDLGDGWGTICDDEWDDVDAGVVCRQLGYDAENARARHYAYFGSGTGTISLDNVACEGHERLLTMCPSGTDKHNCDHTEDAGVECAPKENDARLVGGSSRMEGTVEYFINGRWGTVCNSGQYSTTAEVVCRQVGSPTEFAEALPNSYFGLALGPVAFEDVTCTGNEARLDLCDKSTSFSSSCLYQAASVGCYDTPTTNPSAGGLTAAVIGCLSSAGIVVFVLVVVAAYYIKRKFSHLSALHGRVDRIAENSRGDLRSHAEGNVTWEQPPENALETLSMRVALGDETNITPTYNHSDIPIHVIDILLNVNFENQQRAFTPTDVDRHYMLPPYSPTNPDEDPTSPVLSLMPSPPPYTPLPDQTPPPLNERHPQSTPETNLPIDHIPAVTPTSLPPSNPQEEGNDEGRESADTRRSSTSRQNMMNIPLPPYTTSTHESSTPPRLQTGSIDRPPRQSSDTRRASTGRQALISTPPPTYTTSTHESSTPSHLHTRPADTLRRHSAAGPPSSSASSHRRYSETDDHAVHARRHQGTRRHLDPPAVLEINTGEPPPSDGFDDVDPPTYSPWSRSTFV